MSLPADSQSSAPPAVPLDEVMVAMDVVDTLRHSDDMVRSELSEDERREALVRRIQDIYADQGIAVSEDVIRQGVSALEQDRFTYDPPKRTWSVRLAEIYVRRGFYLKWLLALALVGLLLAAALIVPSRIGASRREADFQRRITTAAQSEQQRRQELEGLVTRLGNQPAAGAEGPSTESILRQVRRDLATAESLQQALVALRTDSPTDEELRSRQAQSERLAAAIGSAREGLDLVDRIRSLDSDLRQALASVAGMDLDAAASEELAQRSARCRALADSGDVTHALEALEDLRSAVEEIARSYQLRIVSRPGQPSGVWRYPEANHRVRNHYVIVEAVDGQGRPVPLDVLDEETGRTNRASVFGIRVSESVFESVKQDKLDNQIIDRPLFGEKPPGTRQILYHYEAAGGRITSW